MHILLSMKHNAHLQNYSKEEINKSLLSLSHTHTLTHLVKYLHKTLISLLQPNLSRSRTFHKRFQHASFIQAHSQRCPRCINQFSNDCTNIDLFPFNPRNLERYLNSINEVTQDCYSGCIRNGIGNFIRDTFFVWDVVLS